MPLVVDCFGDEDTRFAAEAMIALPARVQTGFQPRPLIEALTALAARAPAPPLGLVLGSGFECNPRLIARLAERFPLLGTGAEATRRCKDPRAFHAALDALGISHPETVSAPPSARDGWLMKRIGGSGGLHIIPCPPSPRPDPRRYFQHRAPGVPVSLAAIAHPGGLVPAGLTRQWPSPLPRRPYRYGGSVTLQDSTLEARLMSIARPLAAAFDLVGLVSFDVLLDGETTMLLEINARPGATLDVLDEADGWLFAAHLAAARGQLPAPRRAARRPAEARASAVLYADRGPLTIPAIDWPEWIADRPPAGTTVLVRQPLATVAAEASTTAAAEALCRERLEIAARMLYGPHQGKEAQQ